MFDAIDRVIEQKAKKEKMMTNEFHNFVNIKPLSWCMSLAKDIDKNDKHVIVQLCIQLFTPLQR